MVGLETHLALERGLNFTLVAARAGETRAAELGFNEELCVERERRRVERSSWDGWVDEVSCSNSMPSQTLSSGTSD